MHRDEPILELHDALCFFEESALPNMPLALRLKPGDCALVEAHDTGRAAAFADLCSGMVALQRGSVRCMGFDWDELGDEETLALRGRIGRIHQKGAWPSMLPTHFSIMQGRLHHSREPEQSIARSATELARLVGLPGLPLVRPDRLSEGDLIRAACVRAFLGTPGLLLLESAISVDHAELTEPFLHLLAQALERGAAAICFTRDVGFWQAQAFPLSHRLHLLEDGLAPMRSV